MKEEKQEYVSPQVEVVEVAVERGMELSAVTDGYDPYNWE